MRSSRLTAIVILGGIVVGGLVIDAADTTSEVDAPATLEAGVAMPAATPEGTLSSTWYCAGGTATDDGFADHVVIISNPTDEPRRAVVSVLTGGFAAPPSGTTSGNASSTTTTAPATSTTQPAPEPPEPESLDIPAGSRIEVSLRELVKSPLAAAIVEAHLDLHLGHLVGGVEDHDLLGGIREQRASGEHPHLRGLRCAEAERDALERRIGAVEGLDPVDDHPAVPHRHLRRHLALAGDVLLDERAHHAAAGHHEVLEAQCLARALIGGEVDRDGGVVREWVHEHEQLASAAFGDTPRERPRVRSRGAAR